LTDISTLEPIESDFFVPTLGVAQAMRDTGLRIGARDCYLLHGMSPELDR
jgi:hypothetical protein